MKTIYLLIRMEWVEMNSTKQYLKCKDVVCGYTTSKDADLHVSYLEGRTPIKDRNTKNIIQYFSQATAIHDRFEGSLDGRPSRDSQ